ncbi:FecR family protein [Chryseobacterium indoltheticum]|uniref:FecR family protein n=1 Tax=Chryseobacterium indoltheticum TaxID=254 RepID=A0A381FF17_9FLAO|nr:FecR family protein [Chryseobacterium indoltheticum]AZA74272.1 FecR family protein [Chryseobacterium indoltheticum]SIR35435.1 FecR family protein [Chryseobacterium indoltheticum]SUX45058.1 FecR protein [Chryseobacterium indoltheticum]
MKDSQKYFEKIWTKVSEEKQEMDSATDSRIWSVINGRIKQNNKRKYYWLVAAILVPLFGILFFYKDFESKQPKISLSAIVLQTEESSKTFRLSDNSIITLEPYSKLSINKDFGKKYRNVKFLGKGFFSIAKNKSKPFIVDAGGFSVEVLGTKFSVDQKSDEKKVNLFEGKVKVNHNGKLTYLLPNENWSTSPAKKDYHYYAVTAVKTFTFENTTFEDAINEIENTYGAKITYPNNIAKNQVSGSFSGNLKEILSIINYPFNLKTTIKNENEIILH